MSTSDDGPRVRPIPSEDDEKDAGADSRRGDRTEKRAAKRRWGLIGRRFVEGIPGLKIKRD